MSCLKNVKLVFIKNNKKVSITCFYLKKTKNVFINVFVE